MLRRKPKHPVMLGFTRVHRNDLRLLFTFSMFNMGFISLCLCIVTFVTLVVTSDAVIVRSYCLPSASYNFVGHIRLNTEGDTRITGITAVDASVNPTSALPTASTCTTTVTESTNIYHLAFSQDISSLTCGTTLVSGTTYKMMVRADGTNDYYSFTCDTGSLLPSSVTVSNFATHGVTSNLKHRENPYDVMFQAVEADGNKVPATSVKLGQDIKLRMIYNTGSLENGNRDNWGKVFHTGFIQHTGAELVLLIVTPGLGTKVHITGKLSGKEVDSWVSVKRDSAAEVRIPVEYQATTATKTSWTKEDRGLKIEAIHDRVGVKAVSVDGKGSDFIVLPDDVLGKQYRPFSAKMGAMYCAIWRTATGHNTFDIGQLLHDSSNFFGDMEVLVVGVTDDTTLKITYNSYTRAGSFQVAGDTSALTATSTDNIDLDEYKVLHILCDKQCSELVISADKNFAVVTGFPDHQSEQLVPLIYYGENYVFLGLTKYFQNADPTDPDVVLSDDDAISGVETSPGVMGNTFVTEASFGQPTSVYLKSPDSSVNDAALTWLPSISQWSLYNFFYAQEGVRYLIQLVTTKGDTSRITVSQSGIRTAHTYATLGAHPGFAIQIGDVRRLKADKDAGELPRYESYWSTDFNVINTDPARMESGLIEFRASTTWKPFMMLITETKGSYKTLHLPFGVRYPTLNPCVVSVPHPGDLLDNDCDGLVDEEILNGVDDDKDSNVDEDVALNTVTQYRGIYVKDLLIDDNAGFSSPTQVHQMGCNSISSTSSTAIMKTITPFTHNTALAQQFNHYWVLDTGVFNAFKYITSNTVYFRVVFGFCYGNLDLCHNSCATKRRKRSSAEEDTTVDLKLSIRGNNTDIHFVESGLILNKDDDQIKHPCSDNMIFWIPVTLLLAIILVEIVMLVYLFYKRSHLLKKLQ